MLGRAVLSDELGLFNLPVPEVDDEQHRILLVDGPWPRGRNLLPTALPGMRAAPAPAAY